jgi:hypothetical protein
LKGVLKKMTGTYFTDITHYLDETGEFVPGMPGPAIKLASFLALIIDETSEAGKENFNETGIRCSKRKCKGVVLSRIEIETGEIIWHCGLCGHNGVISNWKGTKWDQSVKSKNPA